jgi:hypothetical protein
MRWYSSPSFKFPCFDASILYSFAKKLLKHSYLHADVYSFLGRCQRWILCRSVSQCDVKLRLLFKSSKPSQTRLSSGSSINHHVSEPSNPGFQAFPGRAPKLQRRWVSVPLCLYLFEPKVRFVFMFITSGSDLTRMN